MSRSRILKKRAGEFDLFELKFLECTMHRLVCGDRQPETIKMLNKCFYIISRELQLKEAQQELWHVKSL